MASENESVYFFEALIQEDPVSGEYKLGRLLQDTSATVGRDGVSMGMLLSAAHNILVSQNWSRIVFDTEGEVKKVKYKNYSIPTYRDRA